MTITKCLIDKHDLESGAIDSICDRELLIKVSRLKLSVHDDQKPMTLENGSWLAMFAEHRKIVSLRESICEQLFS